MTTNALLILLSCLGLALTVFAASPGRPQDPRPSPAEPKTESSPPVRVQYLEIVTAEVDATCDALAKLHGGRFGEREAALGNARTATLAGGGWIGVRAPLRADEKPVVRPYVLVDDIEKAVATAKAAGGEIALPRMPIAGRGTCAIYVQGGIEHGLWQL